MWGLLGVGSDLLLWLLITVVVVGMTTLFDMDAKQLSKHQTTIMLTLQDAYSLSKGSMVRLMGVPIGYVDNVKIAPNNSVIVLLKLNPEIPKLPAGAKGTVVAYGLGGSKSLDFDLPTPTEKQAGNGREAALSISNPLRQKALLQAQIEAAETLEAGANSLAESLSYFPTLQQQGTIATVNSDTFQLIEGQAQLIDSLQQFQQQLSTSTKSAKTLIETFRTSTEKTDSWVDLYGGKVIDTLEQPPQSPPATLPALNNTVQDTRSFWRLSKDLASQVTSLQFELNPLQAQLHRLEQNIEHFNAGLSSKMPHASIKKLQQQWRNNPLLPAWQTSDTPKVPPPLPTTMVDTHSDTN
jgi:ABC-type transporter Mla subunit MlaD